MLGNHLDGVEGSHSAVFLDGLVALLADGYVGLAGRRVVVRRHRDEQGERQQSGEHQRFSVRMVTLLLYQIVQGSFYTPWSPERLIPS